MEFSQIISELMQKSGTSAYRLAKEVGVHQTTIKNWLTGKTDPSFDKLPKICNFFGVSMDVFSEVDSVKEGKRLQETFSRVAKALNEEQKEKPTTNSGEPTFKLNSISRLESEAHISPEEDAQIADFIDYLLKKKKDKK
jgi:transcriptional regulator with XRE-family HTH domain